MSLYSFGINIHGDVLENVEEVRLWESYVLRAIFLVVLATHTPFVLFIGKESVLAIVALIFFSGKREENLRKSTIIIDENPTHGAEKEQLLADDMTGVNNDENGRQSLSHKPVQNEVVDKVVMLSGDNKMASKVRSFSRNNDNFSTLFFRIL